MNESTNNFNRRKEIVKNYLEQGEYVYNDECIQYISNEWTKDHIVEIMEDEIEIDDEDVKLYYPSYIKMLFNGMGL